MKNIKTAVVLISVLALYGCTIIDGPVPAAYTGTGPQSSGQMEKRFTSDQQGAENVVENALKWSQRYEELSEKTEQLRQENQKLILENKDLKLKVSQLESQLTQTKNELTEANEFLQEMNAELNNWKNDVLGYRDEIRQSQAAQLVALKKILKILGAEEMVPSEPETSSEQADN